jgi:hypothetical protein
MCCDGRLETTRVIVSIRPGFGYALSFFQCHDAVLAVLEVRQRVAGMNVRIVRSRSYTVSAERFRPIS